MFSVLVLASLLLAPASHSAQGTLAVTADTSALPLFWAVADTLAVDHEPAPEAWAALFRHPGYQQIDRQAQRIPVLRQCLPIVFRPSRSRELDSVLTGPASLQRLVCTHLNNVKHQRAELAVFAKTLKIDVLVADAVRLAQQYLPAGVTTRFPQPTVYVMIFENNGFGGDAIVLDLLSLKDKERRDNVAFVAHEFHHAFRDRIARTAASAPAKVQSLMLALEQMQQEGLASMIDKAMWLDPQYVVSTRMSDADRANVREFNALYATTPRVIGSIDSLLIAAARDSTFLNDVGSRIREILPWSGHPTGLYMALAIDHVFGRKRLLSVEADPIEFILAYQAAATANPVAYTRFSPESIGLLERLRQSADRSRSNAPTGNQRVAEPALADRVSTSGALTTQSQSLIALAAAGH